MIAPYLLFFFAGLGAFNGLALAGFLLWRRPATPAQRWLAVLVLMVSVRTGKSVLFYFWPEIPKLILQIGLTACFFIGPCLVCFVRAWADPGGERTRRDGWVVAGLAALAIGFGLAFPYADHLELWGRPVGRVVSLAWVGSVLYSIVCLLPTVRPPSAGEPDGLTRGHVAAVVGGVAVVWLAYFTAGLTSYIVGALSFTLVLFLGGIVLLARRRVQTDAEPYQDRKIAADEAEAILQSLHRLMADEALYRDAGVNLVKVARRLNLPPARLTQALNDNYKTPFKQYLTRLRVDAAKRELGAPGSVSIEQVAEACGFLSMSTFYSAFRKVEGTTPAAWRQAQLPYVPDS